LGPRERDNVITRLSRLCCFQGSSAGDRSADGDEPRLRSAPTQSRQQYSVSVVDDSRLSSSDSRRIIRRRSLYHSARACQPFFPEGRSLPCRRGLGGAPGSGGISQLLRRRESPERSMASPSPSCLSPPAPLPWPWPALAGGGVLDH